MDSQKKINEEAFQKVIASHGIDLKNMNEDQIRKSILKREDFSFVIAYDLYLDEIKKIQIQNQNKDSIYLFLIYLYINIKKENLDNSYAFKPIAEDIYKNTSYVDNIQNFAEYFFFYEFFKKNIF